MMKSLKALYFITIISFVLVLPKVTEGKLFANAHYIYKCMVNAKGGKISIYVTMAAVLRVLSFHDEALNIDE